MTDGREDSVLGHVRNALQLVTLLRDEDMGIEELVRHRDMLDAIAGRLQAAVRELERPWQRTDQDDNG